MRLTFFADTNYIGSREWMAHLAGMEGLEVHAICFDGDALDLPDVTFHRLHPPAHARKLRYLTCVPSLRSLLRELKPDLLIAYRVLSYGFAASLTGFQPLVLAAQGQFIVSPEVPSIYRWFAKKAIREARLIHAWAEPMGANLVALGAPRERVMVLPRGVRLGSFLPREEPPPPLTLVTTRQLEPYYNFPQILEALARLRDQGLEFRYLIAGEGSARRSLEDLCRALGLDRSVSFLGVVDRTSLPGLLASAHVYVSAVPTDGVSSSLLEAMAVGLYPVVADNASNRIWVKDGENGRLVPVGDSRALALALERIWDDPSARARARTINRQLVERRASWEANMDEIVRRYREIVEKERARG